jgi:hypothetical protein
LKVAVAITAVITVLLFTAGGLMWLGVGPTKYAAGTAYTGAAAFALLVMMRKIQQKKM